MVAELSSVPYILLLHCSALATITSAAQLQMVWETKSDGDTVAVLLSCSRERRKLQEKHGRKASVVDTKGEGIAVLLLCLFRVLLHFTLGSLLG